MVDLRQSAGLADFTSGIRNWNFDSPERSSRKIPRSERLLQPPCRGPPGPRRSAGALERFERSSGQKPMGNKTKQHGYLAPKVAQLAAEAEGAMEAEGGHPGSPPGWPPSASAVTGGRC